MTRWPEFPEISGQNFRNPHGAPYNPHDSAVQPSRQRSVHFEDVEGVPFRLLRLERGRSIGDAGQLRQRRVAGPHEAHRLGDRCRFASATL
jgi:hypothetical protein